MTADMELRREALDRAAKFAAFGEKITPDAILDLAERVHAFLTAGQYARGGHLPAGIKLPPPGLVFHGQVPANPPALGMEQLTNPPKPEPEKVEQVRVADLLPQNKRDFKPFTPRGQQGAAIDAKIAELKERPGEWVRIKAVKSSAAKNSWVRRGCEARTRTEPDGTMWLYARWPSPARTAEKGPGPKPAAPKPAAPKPAAPEATIAARVDLPAPDYKSDAGAPAPDCPPNLIAERERYEAARRARLNGHRNAR